jgi:phosphatase NudJ
MARVPIPTWCFAVIVVRRGHRFLLVHELKHGGHWYLPAGRVEPGETFVEAARRETLEETGVPVVVEGVLRIEHTPHPDGTARMRVVFVARPVDDRPPREEPNDETLGAAWVALDELDAFSLRGPDVREVFEHVARGAPVYPLSVLVPEGAPFPTP